MAGTSTSKKRPTKSRTTIPTSAVSDLIDERLASGSVAASVINDDGTINPVEIGRAGRVPNELVTLFTLDGKDYKVPQKPSPAIMQRFLRDARKHGPAMATSVLLDTMLGEEALDALAESPEVTDEDMARIYTALTHIAFGKVAKKAEDGQDPS